MFISESPTRTLSILSFDFFSNLLYLTYFATCYLYCFSEITCITLKTLIYLFSIFIFVFWIDIVLARIQTNQNPDTYTNLIHTIYLIKHVVCQISYIIILTHKFEHATQYTDRLHNKVVIVAPQIHSLQNKLQP